MILQFACFLALGVVVGLIAPAAGIAGGLFMVPAFLFLLPLFGVPPDLAVQLAVGSSLGAASLMGVSSVASHARAHNVNWRAFLGLAPGLVAGAVGGGLLSHLLPDAIFNYVFAVLLILVALWLFSGYQPRGERTGDLRYGPPVLVPAGLAIGVIGAMIGIGGGVMLVPLLLFGGLATARAAGTSSAAVFAIVLTGALTYLFVGQSAENLPAWTMGYLYGPAIFATAIPAMIFAPLGARLGRRIPPRLFKRLFALLIIAVAIKLLA
ncbi:MAG: sulfite exporter TauE/SafE family protein [Gammaproteobacteria bacterium]|nr:sulfite exporter TauE/SafE family protein [Gammaproteobacteria bacterium]